METITFKLAIAQCERVQNILNDIKIDLIGGSGSAAMALLCLYNYIDERWEEETRKEVRNILGASRGEI